MPRYWYSHIFARFRTFSHMLLFMSLCGAGFWFVGGLGVLASIVGMLFTGLGIHPTGDGPDRPGLYKG